MPKDANLFKILGSRNDQNLLFYERYDEHFLFSKVLSLQYILDKGEPVIKQIEEHLVSNDGGIFPPKYLESLRAEIFFTTLHQCETFFALLIAIFQPLSHWVYLTTYETREIKLAIEQIVADNNRISELTDGIVSNIRDLIKVAVYAEVIPTEPEVASNWDVNIDNAAWLVQRIGRFFIKYDRAYNSYKHGLRIMTGPHLLGIRLQSPQGSIVGPMHILQKSEDSVTYLQKEPIREVDGEKEIPISTVTKTFNTLEASFYLGKMTQMLETIKATRLVRLKGGGSVESINTFFDLDRDKVRQLAKNDEWKREPARADEARFYDQLFAQMKAESEQEPDSKNTGDDSEPSAC